MDSEIMLIRYSYTVKTQRSYKVLQTRTLSSTNTLAVVYSPDKLI